MKLHIRIILSIAILAQTPALFCQSAAPASLQDLRTMADHDRKSAQTWWYSWIGGYSALTVGQGIIALQPNERSLRQDMVLGAATTLLGAIGTITTPIVPDRSLMKKQEFQMKDQSDSIKYYEARLREISAREIAGRSWKTHAVAGVVDLGSGLITWLGYKRTVWDGVVNFAMNTVIAEAQIWSQPMSGVRDYKKYSSGHKGLSSSMKREGSKIYICSSPGGIKLRAVF